MPGNVHTEEEREERRKRVLTLKIAGQPMRMIASVLNVDVATVSRDWGWIREHWGQEYGDSPSIDVPQQIGDAISRLQDIEDHARATYADLNATTPGGINPPITQLASAKMRCLRMAEIARMDIINFMQDLGILDRQIGMLDLNVMRATDLRKALRAEGLIHGAGKGGGLDVIDVSPEKATQDGHLQRWLTDGEM